MAQDDKAVRREKLRLEAVQRLEGVLSDELAAHLTSRIMEFEGNFDVLESALGALVVGQSVGWRVLTLIHSSRTMKRYQDVLDLDFKGAFPWDETKPVMPEEGPFATKSFAYRVARKIGDFWQVVRGQTDEISSSTERKSSLPLAD